MMLRTEVFIGGSPGPGLTIQQGETIDLGLDWDGENMGGSTVLVKVKSTVDRKQVYSTTLADTSSLTIPAATTALWAPAVYDVEVWWTDSGGVVRTGSFAITVRA